MCRTRDVGETLELQYEISQFTRTGTALQDNLQEPKLLSR